MATLHAEDISFKPAKEENQVCTIRDLARFEYRRRKCSSWV